MYPTQTRSFILKCLMYPLMNSLLVTGATGCTGKATLQYLIALGYKNVLGLTRREPNSKIKGVTYVYGDLTDRQSLQQIFDTYHITKIWHIAAAVEPRSHKELFHQVNVQGTKNILLSMNVDHVEEFFYCSSFAVYGKLLDKVIDETHRTKPIGYYAKSKLQAEEEVTVFCSRYNIKAAIFRIGLIIGHEERHFTHYSIKLLKKNLFPIMGAKKHRLSIVHPYDIANAFYTISNQDLDKVEVFHVISSHPTFKELIQKLEQKIIGKNRWKIILPYPLLYLFTFVFEFFSKILYPNKEPLFNREYARMMGKNWIFDDSKIKEFGYHSLLDLDIIAEDAVHGLNKIPITKVLTMEQQH